MVQYKFIVDGEWRHDEQQAHMVDTNGNVNNWLLVTKQPHHILPPTSDPVTLGATMDVDHDMLHHIVTILSLNLILPQCLSASISLGSLYICICSILSPGFASVRLLLIYAHPVMNH
jgi:hypothetical protein